MNNWQQVSMKECRYLTEQAGFCHKEVDLFDETGADEFFLRNTGFKFKYRASFGDPMTFWVNPTINGKPVAVTDFIKAVETDTHTKC